MHPAQAEVVREAIRRRLGCEAGIVQAEGACSVVATIPSIYQVHGLSELETLIEALDLLLSLQSSNE